MTEPCTPPRSNVPWIGNCPLHHHRPKRTHALPRDCCPKCPDDRKCRNSAPQRRPEKASPNESTARCGISARSHPLLQLRPQPHPPPPRRTPRSCPSCRIPRCYPRQGHIPMAQPQTPGLSTRRPRTRAAAEAPDCPPTCSTRMPEPGRRPRSGA